MPYMPYMSYMSYHAMLYYMYPMCGRRDGCMDEACLGWFDVLHLEGEILFVATDEMSSFGTVYTVSTVHSISPVLFEGSIQI